MKTYKRILILLIGVAIFGLTDVSAYTLKYEASTKTDNKVIVPISISGATASDTLISKLSCTSGAEEVTCSLAAKEGTNFYDANDKALKFLTPPADGTVVVNMILTNNDTSMPIQVTPYLSYDGKTLTEGATSKSVPAKIEERKKSSNNKLKSVTITNIRPTMTPAFNQDVTEYTIYNVSDTVKAIVFDWECAEGSCSVDIDDPAGKDGNKINLNVGENIVKLKVAAEDGSGQRVYSFKVIKGESDFNSSKLKSIVLGDYELSPKFDKGTLEYTAQVPYSLVTLATTLSYEAADPNATVDVKGHDNLVVGENEITIKVKSADGNDETTYKIVVTRLDDQNIIIKSYKDGKIGFIDSTNEKKELSEEEFEKQYPDEYKKIKDGTYKFDEDGNIVKEEANSEDSKEEKKKSKTWLIVLLIVVGIAVIGVSGYFIFKKPSDKKKKKKGDKDDKNDKSKDNKEEKEENKDEEEKTEEDLLNLSDEEVEEVKEKSNPAAELDYDVESEIESVEHTASHRNLDDTIDIDEALSDLMSTRQYNFTEEDKNK